MAINSPDAPDISLSEFTLLKDTISWTEAHGYEIARAYADLDPIVMRSEQQKIYEAEMPRSWNRFRQLRKLSEVDEEGPVSRTDEELRLKASQAALRTVSLARTAFVLSGLAQSASIEKVENITHTEMVRYADALYNHRKFVPTYALLKEPIQNAVNSVNKNVSYGKPYATMTALLGLAVVGVTTTSPHRRGRYVLPQTGDMA